MNFLVRGEIVCLAKLTTSERGAEHYRFELTGQSLKLVVTSSKRLGVIDTHLRCFRDVLTVLQHIFCNLFTSLIVPWGGTVYSES